MLYRIILLLLFCFLTFSCDLPNEVESDCNGISLGSAYIDLCGRCVGGNTSFLEDHDKDICGTCFGNNDCFRCNESNAINYVDIDGEFIDNDLCIYDLCTEYIFNSDDYYECDQSESNSIYQQGDKLRCTDVFDDMDLCFPDNCEETFNLSKLYGKVTWIELTASW